MTNNTNARATAAGGSTFGRTDNSFTSNNNTPVSREYGSSVLSGYLGKMSAGEVRAAAVYGSNAANVNMSEGTGGLAGGGGYATSQYGNLASMVSLVTFLAAAAALLWREILEPITLGSVAMVALALEAVVALVR